MRSTSPLSRNEGHWLVLDGDQVVGICGYKRPPGLTKTIEIGYGIAPEHRRRGYATRAIRLPVNEARADQAGARLAAKTSMNNPTSKLVLERNGFRISATGKMPKTVR